MTTPDPIAEARRNLLTPDLATIHPAITESAWALLKDARGQPMAPGRLDRLARLRDIIRRAENATATYTVADHDAARARATPAIRDAIARLPNRRMPQWLQAAMRPAGPTGGDAA